VPLGGFGGMLPRKKILYILRLNASIWCSTHELLIEQRKSIDLYLDIKEGSNIFLVMRVSVYYIINGVCFRMPNNYYNNVIMIYIIIHMT
jgi:hypothetical protein